MYGIIWLHRGLCIIWLRSRCCESHSQTTWITFLKVFTLAASQHFQRCIILPLIFQIPLFLLSSPRLVKTDSWTPCHNICGNPGLLTCSSQLPRQKASLQMVSICFVQFSKSWGQVKLPASFIFNIWDWMDKIEWLNENYEEPRKQKALEGVIYAPHNDLSTKAVLRKMWIKNAFSQHQQKGWCHVTHTSWHIFLRSPTLKIFRLKRYLLVACALGKGRQSGVHKGEWTWSTARTCTTTSTVTLVYHACTATTTPLVYNTLPSSDTAIRCNRYGGYILVVRTF